MKGLEEFIFPYVLVQVISLLFLAAAFRNPRIARLMFSLLFLYAFWYNLKTSQTNPSVYLEYANMAIPLYRDFINGWFSRHIQETVFMIALGQFLIGAGMLLNRYWVLMACWGAIVFLLAIAPLLVGSGFPFSLTVSAAALLVLIKDQRDYIWQAKHLKA